MSEVFRSIRSAILGAMALSVGVIAGAAAAQDKPNVVLMVTDNLGWGEIGVYGGGILRGAETPRLDALAAEGMRLLNYNVEPQCTPSRSALMSGRHPIRHDKGRLGAAVWSGQLGKDHGRAVFGRRLCDRNVWQMAHWRSARALSD